MKQMIMGAVLLALAVGCQTTRDTGAPEDIDKVEVGEVRYETEQPAPTYQPGPNDRHTRSSISNNQRSTLSW